MDFLVDICIKHLNNIDWNGPAVFVIILLGGLMIFRKWSILLLTILTIVLGWGAQDLVITNLESSMKVISVPLVIYCIGGGTVIILILFSFFRS